MKTFYITIKEIHKGTMEVEANSYEEALEKADKEYWKDPNAYLLEPNDTFFE